MSKMTDVLKLDKVQQYFRMINVEASSSEEEFWAFLNEHHDELAAQFREAISSRKGDQGLGNIYTLKNQNLDFGLDVAKRLADFYKKYCSWVATNVVAPPNRLLDIGCDNGIITCFYAYLYPEAEVIGVDKSKSGIRCANQLAQILGLSNVSFVEMDFNEINHHFPNESFDMITSVRTLHEVMGTIPFPVYWNLKDYLDEYPVKADFRYIKKIESLLEEDGKYISAERLENPAAVGQWANVLKLAGLSLDWDSSGFIEFHETGTNHKAPVLISSKTNQQVDTIDGLYHLYTRGIDLNIETNGAYKSVAAELIFDQFPQKKFLKGLLLDFDQNWYKMSFEIWSTSDHVLVYGSGNMGFRKLEVMSIDSINEADKKIKEFLSPYEHLGVTVEYKTLKKRSELS
jgi:SAM-dependent methyltransferase